MEEAAASGAEVRFSEAVLDVRMQHSEAGTPRVAGALPLKPLSLLAITRACEDMQCMLSLPVSAKATCVSSEVICPGAEFATSSGAVQADTFVLAAGLGTPGLARMAGVEVPLDHKPATLNVYTVPAPLLLRHMLLSGGFLFSLAAIRLMGDTSGGEACTHYCGWFSATMGRSTQSLC